MSDLEIARAAKLEPIEKIGARIGLPAEALYRYGPNKRKCRSTISRRSQANRTASSSSSPAINPTPAGEGKTTTTVGLGDALSSLGHKAVICLREPSLGPCFGMKGGAAGGGYAQVVPMDEINLHFTGDFHAITAANNLLAALIDNQVYWGNPLGIDPSKISWRRVMDMNDRALRDIVVGLGGNGQVREDGFDITVASEVMAIFCLATSLADLEERIDRIVVARDFAKKNVTAKQVQAAGAMSVLLRDAMQPNLVQTLEHTPAFVHGGPFANIAHGCNSVIATKTALKLADYVVTEAGFGADLGAEKFFDIKCRQSGLTPSAAVIVATVRALKMHGGVDKKELANENVAAVKAGMANLLRHIENVRKFGVPVTVAITISPPTPRPRPMPSRRAAARSACTRISAVIGRMAGKAHRTLAHDVVRLTESGGDFKPLYPDDMALADKIRTIAREIYRAADISLSPDAAKKLKQYEADGFGRLPVCMAKTQYSFTAEPDIRGAPTGHILPVRDVRLSAGAGFVVALCGDLMTMPGLPRDPRRLSHPHRRERTDRGIVLKPPSP